MFAKFFQTVFGSENIMSADYLLQIEGDGELSKWSKNFQ